MTAKSRFESKSAAFWIHLLAFTSVFCLITIGCGGGGGGGGDSAPSLTYSGLSTPAEITSDNAEGIAVGALAAGSSGSGFTGIAALDGTGQAAGEPGRPFMADVVAAMASAVGKMDFQSSPAPNSTAAVQSESDSISGACGGSASYSISVNTDTGAFSGRLSFNSYCEDGMTMSGSASFSGMVDLYSKELVSFTLSFDYITAASGSESVTMDGEIDIAVSGLTTMITMNMMVRDNSANRVCKVVNYQMNITDQGYYTDIEINGRFFDPDYGYVDLETISPLQFYNGYENPSDGQLVLTGKIGTAGGPTSIRLTAIDENYCQVEADIDGSGTYDGPPVDYDSGVILWTDL